MAQFQIRLLPLSDIEAREIILNDGSFLLGRETLIFKGSEDSHLKKLSREHARLDIQGASVLLSDLGSTNGTRINTVPLDADQPKSLNDGDVISFADVFDFQVKLVEYTPQDAQTTQRTRGLDDDTSIHNKTLFLGSADSYLEMLVEESPGAASGKTIQPRPRLNPLRIVLLILFVVFVSGALYFWRGW